MAKSKGNYHKKKKRSQNDRHVQRATNGSNLPKPTENKNVYTKEYLDYKHEKETTKPLILRIFVVALAFVILLGFVIAPLF